MPRITLLRPVPARLLLVGVLLGGTVPLTACGTPPELRQPPGSTIPTHQGPPPATTAPTAPPVPLPTLAPPLPPTPAEQNAGPCRSGPGADQMIALLRRTGGLLPGGVRAKVTKGPLCADGWQYAAVDVTGHDALEMVSRGRSGSLRLVTAGTDVCSIEVRTLAPSGIRALACEGASGAGVGA